ncbi:hypothetical protein RRSWK_01548 [Rhodopirellula sp. SWK7]|nr:hypothetical protein RRSWK_01548 [Rhodopirellula sp. SWK7]
MRYQWEIPRLSRLRGGDVDGKVAKSQRSLRERDRESRLGCERGRHRILERGRLIL